LAIVKCKNWTIDRAGKLVNIPNRMLKPLICGVTLALLGGWISGFAEDATPPSANAYLFTYATKNGEDGLHLAWSSDGYKWEALNGGQSYLAPTLGKEKLMRAPHVARGADGVFHLIWAVGINESTIGHASSRDLIHWSNQQEIPVMASEPATRNSWGPEMVYDAKWKQFFIFWSSAIKGKFTETERAAGKEYNNRIYCSTTKDFSYFTPTRLFYDPEFPVSDATILVADGHYYLIVKDDTTKPARKNLRIAVADDLGGPYGDLDEPFTPKRVWAEGPSAIKIGDEYIVYFDAYIENHYGAMSSRNLKTWQDVTAKMTFPGEDTPGRAERMRHGTVLSVPMALIEQLRAAPAH
jgi:hypothetical protein